MSTGTDTLWGRTDDLAGVLDQIWESFTDEPAGLDFSVGGFEVPTGTPLLDAHVELLGRWQGRVRLVCAETTAQEIAARILAVPAAELEPEDVRDALGEITNILGGNVKSMLSGVERLSLPFVRRAFAPADEPVGRAVDSCTASWQGHLLMVHITTGDRPPHLNETQNLEKP